jgi:hypothetical protein
MTISMQTLQDTIVAIIATVGIAVAVSLIFVAVGGFVERSKAQARKLAHVHSDAALAQQPTQSDKPRELVLR